MLRSPKGGKKGTFCDDRILFPEAKSNAMARPGSLQNTQPRMVHPFIIYGALSLGVATAVAFRAILIFNYLQPGWVRPVWYFAVVGNFVFFFYRFRIAEKRKRSIEAYSLMERIGSGSELSSTERDVLIYLLRSIHRSPENINYLIIFVFSILAIALDLILAAMPPGG